MKEMGKWFARIGSLLILLGFFLPSLSVSCSAFPEASQPVSLSFLAGQEMFFLYLVPFCALVGGILAFLPDRGFAQATRSMIGQAVALAIGGLSIISALTSLYIQFSQYGIDFSPEFGSIVLLLGYGLVAAGLIMQFMGGPARVGAARSGGDAVWVPPPVAVAPPRQTPSARLEVVKGQAPKRIIPIQCSDFSIGRSETNNLKLSDDKVSRRHVLLRYAQGAWFIQDQGSKHGTFVNGHTVKATRLKSGDNIQIGETNFVFHAGDK